VTASFASVADVILAEPGAMIGFAGSRVIQQATYETLPDGFQTAEFLLKHGMIDLVVARADLPASFRQLLDLYDHQPVEPVRPVEAPTPATRPAIVP
jgi:acetyl-CoA carboxylase carboxyl transferase subunit beta